MIDSYWSESKFLYVIRYVGDKKVATEVALLYRLFCDYIASYLQATTLYRELKKASNRQGLNTVKLDWNSIQLIIYVGLWLCNLLLPSHVRII